MPGLRSAAGLKTSALQVWEAVKAPALIHRHVMGEAFWRGMPLAGRDDDPHGSLVGGVG